LDREDVRVTANTRREEEPETDVRLTGLVARLTSPSRNYSDLVDIWFGIERRRQTLEWNEAFVRVAEGWRPDPRQPSHFALFSHPSSSALIVARQVSRNPAVWSEIEVEARALVSRVNRAVVEQRALPVETGRSNGWPFRGRAVAPEVVSRNWLGEVAQLFRGVLPKPTIPVSHSSSTGVR
jgi:hypothetical protein